MAVAPEPVVSAVLAITARGVIVKQFPISMAFGLLAAALEEAVGVLEEEGWLGDSHTRICDLIPDGGAALKRALDAARDEGQLEDRKAFARILRALRA